jgi:hypothetical protein
MNWIIKDAQIIDIKAAKGLLKVLGIPFGSPQDKDFHGEWFSKNTNIGMEIGDTRPVFYFHGENPEGNPEPNPEVIGRAVLSEKTEKGWWFDVILDKSKEYATRIIEAAQDGLARASSGTAGYLKRWALNGEILNWPIAELTLIDKGEGRIPANDLAVVAVKAIYAKEGMELPQAFVGSGEDEADAERNYDFDSELVQKLLSLREK